MGKNDYLKKKIKNGLWDILETNLSKEEFESLCKRLGRKYDYYPGELFEQLNRTRSELGQPQNKATKVKHAIREYVLWVQIFYFVYNISWKLFDVTETEIFDEQCKGDSKIKWLRTDKGNRLEGNSFYRTYLGVCESALNKVENRLLIYEYLGKTSFKEPDALDEYHGANSDLYTIIESKLTKSFEYVRFIALPLDLSIQINISKELSYHDEALVHFIRLCPFALLVHIFNSFAKYPAIYTDNDPDFTSGFYIAPYTSRTHHFAVLDKKTTFGEYYRWNDQSIVRPDMLFLESNNETSELLAKVYEWEIRRLLKTPHRRLKLHPESIKNLSETVLNAVQAQYNYLDVLKKNPDYHGEDDNIVYAKNELNAVRKKHEFIQKFFGDHFNPK